MCAEGMQFVGGFNNFATRELGSHKFTAECGAS